MSSVIDRQFRAAEDYRTLWVTLMPGQGEEPPYDCFVRWAGVYNETLVSRGINRAAGKRRKLSESSTPMSLEDVIKYASSVMRNEHLGVRRFGN